MAGDWIKMRSDLHTHPKVVRIASALKADSCPDRLRVIGALHAVWCLFDAHSEDGRLSGYTLAALDELIGWEGFSAQMATVEWLEQDGQSLVIPRFSDHNGASAKRRAQESQRKRTSRNGPQSVRKLSACDADEKRTREEKRREEVNPLLSPPTKTRKKPATEAPDSFEVTEDLAAWAMQRGIPEGQIVPQTERFLNHHRAKGTRFSDWRAGWRTWMLKSVEFAR